MSLKRSATVDSSDSEDRFVQYRSRDGRMYYYDTWFNAVLWSKDNATKDAAANSEQVHKGSEKTTDSQEFPRPQPAKLGKHGGAWYRDAETGEIIFENHHHHLSPVIWTMMAALNQ